uniref:Uncharacterized protein n=1 Tax=Arundo donax TaxID=35708 RepID=A0A0A9HPY8_ARUDO
MLVTSGYQPVGLMHSITFQKAAKRAVGEAKLFVHYLNKLLLVKLSWTSLRWPLSQVALWCGANYRQPHPKGRVERIFWDWGYSSCFTKRDAIPSLE